MYDDARRTYDVVFAPDGFKGSISAVGAAAALARGWADVRPGDTVTTMPMADGGEGTVDAFDTAVAGATRIPVEVRGPHDRPVSASWLLLPPRAGAPYSTGVVELASTSGIELLDTLRPFEAHTIGFGEAMSAALDHGVEHLVLGIGSSGSTEGGAGMLAALGARLLKADGTPIAQGLRGLDAVASVDRSALRPPPARGAIVVTDVTAPLTGPGGAADVFGPQKGLDAEGVGRADAALAHFAGLFPDADASAPGAGAAGGTGFALQAWGARLVSGADHVGELIGLPQALRRADIVVTGEGSFDRQSGQGKVPGYVAHLAADRGTRALLAAGRIAPDADVSPFATSASLTDLAGSGAAARSDAARWLREAGRQLAASA